MTQQLHVLVALQKPAKSEGEGAITKTLHSVPKRQPLTGVRKTYEPLTEDGTELPDEGNRLQTSVAALLSSAIAPVSRMIDLNATVEFGNQAASADVIDPDTGEVLLAKVPVGALMMLERKIKDIAAIVAEIPTLDPSETWIWDKENQNYRTAGSKKNRTDKVPTTHVKAPATDKHPAQTEILYLDKAVGVWTTVNYSGAVSESTKRDLSERVRKLAYALKAAREKANTIQVGDFKVADAIFDYLGWADINPKG